MDLILKRETKNMSTRPSDDEFLEWVKNDQNKPKVQNALRAHPDLAHIKDTVSFYQCFLLYIIFTFSFSFSF